MIDVIASVKKPPPLKKKDFFWSDKNEPHAERKKAILKKYPEVKKLMGPCSWTKWQVLITVLAQVVIAKYIADTHWAVFWFVTYAVSGTLNQSLLLAVHELSHNLAFKTARYNRYLALFANLPIGIPEAVTFKRYHLEHHKLQGEDHVDVDIPSDFEAAFFRTPFRKAIFLLFQSAFYGLRPLIVQPKAPSFWEFVNIGLCLSFNVVIYASMSGWALTYLVFGSLLGMGIHPVAGHFISEHYMFAPGHETYSYYGPLNMFTFNVGYHNEHHDFPNIPGSRLAQLKKMAPEFYDNIPVCSSWVGVLYNFIFDPAISGYSRVKRSTLSESQRKDLHAAEARYHACGQS